MSDAPIIFDKPFPEVQIRAPYQSYFNKVLGHVLVTSGFMEPQGHGFKSFPSKAIYKNGLIKTIQPGRYNIGFDYTKGFGSDVICMYSGEVVRAGLEGGYGNRIHIKLDLPFKYEGKEHTCYQAYAHCSRLLKAVGQRVAQGEAIGIEAGHGGQHPRQYGSHVDLDTYCWINGEKVHINFELLAVNTSAKDYVETIESMSLGSQGLDVRWLQQALDIVVDGQFGSKTQAAVEAFQRLHSDLVVDGIAGERTCRKLGLLGYAIFVEQDTAIQRQPLSSNAVVDAADQIPLNGGFENLPLLANWIESVSEKEYWHFELKAPRNDQSQGYVLKSHVSILKGYDAPLDEQDDVDISGDLIIHSNDQGLDKWELALKHCPTEGCKIETARPEGLSEAGVSASHEIAKRDLINVTPALLTSIQKAASKFNVPGAIIVALASRESHIGTILGKFGNNPGWGDNNHGWGILQVDRRHHTVLGLDDPFSAAHIDQAIGIFNGYRDQVALKHPDWSDEYVLKGACVAYNSGVGNVGTIARMNVGTTHNDYGDDVIARAQFYLTALESI